MQSTPVISSTQNTLLMTNAIQTVLKFPPLFQFAKRKAREKIIKKGEVIGVNWNEEKSKLSKATDWTQRINDLKKQDLVYPDYYTKPFHAYDQGNLCLEAALEVELASDCVHADVMDPKKQNLDKEGDWNLRRSYHEGVNAILKDLKIRERFDEAFDALDVGCSSGRSSRAILEAFPSASVTGIDLSPYFLAVGSYLQEQRIASGKSENLTFVHGAMEDNEFEDAILGVLKSAWRVLRPNGVICIMEMDPESTRFVKMSSNPFALAGFKSTEPWVLEYVSTNLELELENIGFGNINKRSNSPGHKTIVGVKPSL